MKNKTLHIQCEKCGYTKKMVVDMEADNAKEIVSFQEEKACPNCGSKGSLHILNAEKAKKGEKTI